MEKQTNSRPFANKKIFRTGKLGISPIRFVEYVSQLGTENILTTLNTNVDIIIMGAEPSSVAIERYDRMVRDQGYSAQVYSESEFYELIKNTLGIVPEIEDYSNNPFWYRRIILNGQFSQHSIEYYRQMLQKRGALLYPDQVSKNTNFIVLGDNPDKTVIDAIEKLEFNGFHLKRLNEDNLLSFLNGERCDFFVTEETPKSLSLSIKHLTKKAFPFDKFNPFSTKELFLGKQIKGDRQCFRQAMGNLGAFTNDTMESDTDVCVLSDETYNSLMKGEKDETIQYIENYYNVEAGDVFTYEFVTEGVLMKWAKQHCKAISDNCTLEYINKYLGVQNSPLQDDIEEPEIMGYYSICNNVDKNINKAGEKYGIETSAISDCSDMGKICTDIHMLLGKHAEISEYSNNSNCVQNKSIKSFVAIDFEYVDGKNEIYKKACEIGLVKFEDGKEIATFSSLLHPLVDPPYASTTCSHFKEIDLLNAPTFTELQHKVKEFIDGNMLVCHNHGTDLNILFYLGKGMDLYNIWADTQNMLKDFSEAENTSLEDNYIKLFGIPMENHHQALDDARACGRVFIELSNRMDEIDISKYIKYEPYIPQKERENAKRQDFSSRTEPADALNEYLEYPHISGIDFTNKKYTISGKYQYRSAIEKWLNSIGAINQGENGPYGNTDYFIISDNVGPRKQKKAINFKKDEKICDSFHIISQEAIARFLGLC